MIESRENLGTDPDVLYDESMRNAYKLLTKKYVLGGAKNAHEKA